MPLAPMLASKVVFRPRFCGAQSSTLALRYVTKHAGQKGKCSPPTSSTKTSRSGSTFLATTTLLTYYKTTDSVLG